MLCLDKIKLSLHNQLFIVKLIDIKMRFNIKCQLIWLAGLIMLANIWSSLLPPSMEYYIFEKAT